jgi:hypothetical protein
MREKGLIGWQGDERPDVLVEQCEAKGDENSKKESDEATVHVSYTSVSILADWAIRIE